MSIEDVGNKERSVRDMLMKDRVHSIGIDVVDSVLAYMSGRLHASEIDPVIVLCTLTHLLSNSTPGSVKRILGIPDEKYKNSIINAEIEGILTAAKGDRDG